MIATSELISQNIGLVYKAMYANKLTENQIKSDMGQHVWMRLMAQAKSFNPEKGKLSTWIFTTVRFAVMEARKNMWKPEQLMFVNDYHEHTVRYFPETPDIMLYDKIYEFIDKNLEAKEKKIVLECFYNHKPFREIAKELGMSKSRIGFICRKAIIKIKQHIGDPNE
jgi:RNA polymerase sigma factor (sigma-70 family)